MDHGQGTIVGGAVVFNARAELLPSAGVKYRECVKLVESHGWVLHRSRGSHFHYRHPTRPGIVTIPARGKMNAEVPPGTLNSILKEAGIR